MPLTRLSKKFTLKRPAAKTGDPPRRRPVGPELARRLTRRGSESAHTRRQMALQVLPRRRRDRGSGDEARPAARAGRR